MEKDLELLTQGNKYRDETCDFIFYRKVRQIQHTDAHFIVSIGDYDYMENYEETAAKHGQQKHSYNKFCITQLDSRRWGIVKPPSDEFPEVITTLPMCNQYPVKACRSQ